MQVLKSIFVSLVGVSFSSFMALGDIQLSCPNDSKLANSNFLPKPSGPKVVSQTNRNKPLRQQISRTKAPYGYSNHPNPPKLTPTQVYAMNANIPKNGVYPWRKGITATVFWIGEKACRKNPVPNDKSSWDASWQDNYGGTDDPSDRAHIAYLPKDFIPKLNPFYIALPYNDIQRGGRHKEEASRVIPWFHRDFTAPGKTVCKGKWLQISYNGKHCFAQWEDCGPFTTDDWEYVFGQSAPENSKNNSAGIDISPAVRDYLGVRSGEKVDWRFVEARRVPDGPWAKFGMNNHLLQRFNPEQARQLSLKVKQLPPRSDCPQKPCPSRQLGMDS